MAKMDCRLLAMLALGTSLLLLGGIIFLRHHYRHLTAEPPASVLPPPRYVSPNSEEESFGKAPVVERDCSSGGCEEVSDPDTKSTAAPPPQQSNLLTDSNLHINDSCLRCICEAETGCVSHFCGGDFLCGPFKIREEYWSDAGKQSIDGVVDDNGKPQSEYLSCVNNFKCASRTVSAYIRRFSRDCNGDGMIDCVDYMLIHHFGPTGCLRNEDVRMEFKLDQCLLRSMGRSPPLGRKHFGKGI